MNSQQTSSAVIKALKHLFAKDGIPYELMTDNGPCFASSEFAKFARDWDFKHTTSSPWFSQSNGLAENAVKIVKRIFQKCLETKQDPYMGLLNYRASPLECGKSPAELHNGGRNIRSNLPMASHTPGPDGALMAKKAKLKERQRLNHDRTGVVPLEPLAPQDMVRVKDSDGLWTVRAKVLREVAPRSYLVRTERGSVCRRNRRDLRSTSETPQEFQTQASYSDLLDQVVDLVNQHSKRPSPAAPSTPPLVPAELPVLSSARPVAPLPRMDTPVKPATPRPSRVIRRPQRLIESY